MNANVTKTAKLTCDYLVVGCGVVGMAFADGWLLDRKNTQTLDEFFFGTIGAQVNCSVT